ncbi:MAG: hypothetical protein WA810_09045 [Maribacter sp.]
MVEIQNTDSMVNEMTFPPDPIEIRIDGEGRLFLKNTEISNLQKLEEGLLKLNQNLSKAQREQNVSAIIMVAANTPKQLIENIDRILVAYGVATINVLGPEPAYKGTLIETVTEQSQTEKYNSLAKKYNAIPIEKRVIPSQDLKVLETVYGKMSSSERKAAQPFPECLPKNKQDGATRQQMKEYNALAKTYNEMLEKRGNLRILKSDVDRLEYLYSLMSEKQRDAAEPFPDFPEPPPAPEAPEPPNEREEASRMIKEIIAEQYPYDVVGGNISLMEKPSLPQTPQQGFYLEEQEMLSKAEQARMEQHEKLMLMEEAKLQRQEEKLAEQEIRLSQQEQMLQEQETIMRERERITREHNAKRKNHMPLPPAPPEPVSPLDHIIDMAKKGATFHYENEPITADKAIELLKKNTQLNIESINTNGTTVINITKSPVRQ